MRIVHEITIGLVVLTVLTVLLFVTYGDSRELKITPSLYPYMATNDQSQGGISQSSLETTDGVTTLTCSLAKSEGYPWPYCGVSIALADDKNQGLDLSSFHTVRVNIDFEQLGEEASPALRFYLRNFNPAYANAEDEYTLKYNGISYTPGISQGYVDIPLANFQVLTWWLADNKIPIQYSAPEFKNITLVELATGSGHNEGDYRLTINSIEFIGHYIAGETLMFALLSFWVTLVLVYSLIAIRRSRVIVSRSQRRQEHLRKLNKQLQEENVQFAEIANRDALTGAMNRHSIRGWLDKAFDNNESDDKVLSVLYIDIDYFKEVNDQFGHSMGDDILREFTMVVWGILNSSDRLVRWGGEEFVVFAPQRTLDEAIELAERIRATIESHSWVHRGSLSTSIGVATLGDEKTNEMLLRADEALYRAKHQGRNKVVVSE